MPFLLYNVLLDGMQYKSPQPSKTSDNIQFGGINFKMQDYINKRLLLTQSIQDYEIFIWSLLISVSTSSGDTCLSLSSHAFLIFKYQSPLQQVTG